MKRLLTLILPFLLLLAGFTQPPTATSTSTVYNIVDYSGVNDGLAASAPANTVALQKAITAAVTSPQPGTVYIPPGKGFVITNGAVKISSSNVKLWGDASMGSSDPVPTSTLIGTGPGSTITVTGNGCSVSGLVFRGSGQSGSDASVLVTGQQVTVDSCYIDSPNIGISFQLPPNAAGQFWARNILVGGAIKTAAVTCSAGNGAVKLDHVRAFNNSPVQPPYGICITSCGEAVICGGCDIDNCGTNLAIVPGLNNTKGQYCAAIYISDSLFDNGNGPGQVLVQPTTDSYVNIVRFSNVWTSSINNSSGVWNTNGFTFIGDQTHPPAGTLPIQDINLVNCTGRNMVRHCGIYARGIQGLSVQNSTFSSNFTGIQIGPGCPDYSLIGNKCGSYAPGAVGFPAQGNSSFGILVEPNAGGIVMGNLLRGNGAGTILNQHPVPGQVIFGNTP